ncbi:hypothetical protein OF83DRAFT_1086186 [Amylostereum chailletii]|nr:hypothetical protein OF83DRAFT_1086186 [Amylostereum chailletii]
MSASSSLPFLLNIFNETSLSQFIILIFTSNNLSGHPAFQDLLLNLTSVLEAIRSNSHGKAGASAWAVTTTTAICRDEVVCLTHDTSGLHFNAQKATAEKLESFNIRKMAATMELILLEADDVLRDRRERRQKARTKSKAAEAGLEDANQDVDDEEDNMYASELGIMEELDGHTEGLTGSNAGDVRSKSESWLTVRCVAILSILMKSTNQRCNTFASVLGLFMHSSNVPERVLDVVSHIGLAISSTAINNAVNHLENDALIKIKALARTFVAAIGYDNFDVAFNVAEPTIENAGKTLAHLTSGTLIQLEHNELWEKSAVNPNANVPPEFTKRTYKDLLNLHPEKDHLSGLDRQEWFQAWQIRQDLLAHGPEYFRRFRAAQDATQPEAVEQVPVVKTTQLPFQALNVNESTMQGNIDTIKLFLKQAGLGDSSIDALAVDISDQVIIFHGDLATIERIQSIQESRSQEKTPWNRFQYVVAVPGLFHVKMASVVKRYVADGTFKRDQNPSTKDTDFENSQLRNKSYLIYEEISYAMNQGDIGRLEESLAEWILIFKGTGKHKYAYQMEKFLLDVHFLFPPGLRRAIRMNWMCNPKGQPGAFRGVDWLVERNNLYTKHIYGGRFSNNTLSYMLKESILIELYRMLHVNIEDNFCLTNRTINHTKPDMTSTYKKVAEHMEEDKHCPHLYKAEHVAAYTVKNPAREGEHRIQTAKTGVLGGGQLASNVGVENLDTEASGTQDVAGIDELAVEADDLAIAAGIGLEREDLLGLGMQEGDEERLVQDDILHVESLAAELEERMEKELGRTYNYVRPDGKYCTSPARALPWTLSVAGGGWSWEEQKDREEQGEGRHR